MRVRFLEGQRAGTVGLLPFHVARPLIEARRVEAIDKVVETATEAPVESVGIMTPIYKGKGKRSAAVPKKQ